MAETDVTPVDLVTNEASADQADLGVVADTPADGWSVDTGGLGRHRIMLVLSAHSENNDTVTIAAGDKPPAETSGLGDLAVSVDDGEIKMVVVEGARFMRDDGTILATCGEETTKLLALKSPA